MTHRPNVERAIASGRHLARTAAQAPQPQTGPGITPVSSAGPPQ
jgi:hypothetical protein